MCLAQGPQRSDAGEARTRYPSVSSQALYHWATALPTTIVVFSLFCLWTLVASTVNNMDPDQTAPLEQQSNQGS